MRDERADRPHDRYPSGGVAHPGAHLHTGSILRIAAIVAGSHHLLDRQDEIDEFELEAMAHSGSHKLATALNVSPTTSSAWWT